MSALDLSGLAPVGLEEVLAAAARLSRVDRKYLVPVDVAQDVVDRLAGTHRLLTVAGRSCTTYASTYFDTPDLRTARAHVQGRRRRWKTRSRLYVEDRLCRLEVKVRDARGVTLKTVVERDPRQHGTLGREDSDFVASVLAQHRLDLPAGLEAASEVTYRRVTLADLAGGTRVTIDQGVRCSHAGGEVLLDPGFVLVETKGDARPGQADRVLARHGRRPTSFSKYVAGVSLLGDQVPANDVLALVGGVLHVDRGAASTRALLERHAS